MGNRNRKYLDETNGLIINPYNPTTWSNNKKQLTSEQKAAVSQYVENLIANGRQRQINAAIEAQPTISERKPTLYDRILDIVPERVGNNLERIRYGKQNFDNSAVGHLANFTPYGFVSSGLDLADAKTNEAALMALIGFIPGGKQIKNTIRLANISKRQLKIDAAKYATGIEKYPTKTTLRTWKYGAPSVYERYSAYMDNPRIPLANSSLDVLKKRAELNVMKKQVPNASSNDLRWLIKQGYGGENFKDNVAKEYDNLVKSYTERLNKTRNAKSGKPFVELDEGVAPIEPKANNANMTPAEALSERNIKRKNKRKAVGKYSLRGGMIAGGIYGGGQLFRTVVNHREHTPYIEPVQDTIYNYR